MGRSSGGGGGGGGEGCGEVETCGIADCSPGIIVWVRRRNGSWWPGRILGPDELPASQVMSPKTGTPVKLLGREDASVDWYNLEKSKRVKAFRCGEFDACIEKAKSSQGTPVKRREKYARREDAILHALELERKQLASKYQNQGSSTDDISSIPFADMRKEFDNPSSEYYSKNCAQKPQSPLENSASKQCKDLSSTRYKSKKSKKRKGDNSNLPGKTNGHEKNFLHAGSKRNFSGALVLGASENNPSNMDNGFSNLGHIQAGITVESSGKNTSLKKKRSKEGVFEESLVIKHDRCRPPAQVVQSIVKLPQSFQHADDSATVLVEEGKDPLPTIYQAKQNWSTYMSNDSGDTNSHGDIPSTQMTPTGAHFETEGYLKQLDSFPTEQTFSDFVEKQGSDSLERECSETETEDDAELLQRYAKRQSPESDACDPYSLQASNKLKHGDVDDDDVAFSICIPQQDVLKDEDGSSDLGVSQWHMKGKRNHRALKRPMGKTDGNLSLDKSNSLLKGSHSEVRYIGKDYSSSLKPTRDLGQSYTSFNDTGNYCKTSPPNKNGDQISYLGRKAYLEGASLYRQNYVSHLSYMAPMLFNVDLNVQAGYQGEHVPLVSLMSRLNGKAIVGHPIQIEILEDGSTDHLVLASDDFLEHSASASPAWCTGRRTAMPRVPRSNTTRVTLDGGDYDALWDMKPPFNRCQILVKQSDGYFLRRIANHLPEVAYSQSYKNGGHCLGWLSPVL
ncbi:hypothetical protein GUJ93_ZPchr0458g22328 [Zizania palustris]|uniref:PWWP domain-containing protein n=1 Tax=Zizania palustris TaxID=103762 RepID=A0A8J5UUL2_ZIZPA|nr:hypothetical protein GUJ93_ZPchr0458g22328 [Zizania palustris]